MESNLYDAVQIASQFIDKPLYCVSFTGHWTMSDAEHRYVLSASNDGTIAFTSPACDLAFKSGYLKYEWRGRGCCIVFAKSPLLMTEVEALGVLLHEMAHYIANFNHPSRDESDPAKALQAEWHGGRTSSEHHNGQWLRAAVHLWHRVCRMGVELPFYNVLNLGQYGYDRSHLLPLLNEASQRERESIESILRSGATSQVAATRQRSQGPRVEMIAGEPVTFHLDGTVEAAADLYGRGGGTYRSVRELLQARERQLQVA